MEVVFAAQFFICFAVAALSAFFLFSVQPVWAIIDIAVSEKLSQGAKVTLLLLILVGAPVCIFSVVGIVLIPFIALIPFFYACFFTASSGFRKATRFSFVFLVGALIGIGSSALLSAGIREKIQQVRSLELKDGKIYLETEETLDEQKDDSISTKSTEYGKSEETVSDSLTLADVSIDPFYAIYFVPPKNESIAKFSAQGADLNSATPFKRPSIYPLNHIAVDPDGPTFYGVTTHKFGIIDSQTGEFEEITIIDESIPRLSWPGGIAFDSRRKRILITSRGHLYAYYPETNYWEAVADSKEIPIVYSPQEDLLYGLEAGGRKLKKTNMRGAVVGDINLSQTVPTANTWDDIKVQIVWSADKILILALKDSLEIYIIDPLTGEVVCIV
jgi:hypothetical protein